MTHYLLCKSVKYVFLVLIFYLLYIIKGGSNANTGSWGSNQPPQQQWDQPSGSNSAVSVNAANANVGQNATMWPPATGTNPGKDHFNDFNDD